MSEDNLINLKKPDACAEDPITDILRPASMMLKNRFRVGTNRPIQAYAIPLTHL